MTSRRTFLLGMAGILATATSPGIVQCANLMPIKALKPDGILTEAMLEEAMIRLLKFTDSQGKALALRPTKLLVHPTQLFHAMRIMPKGFGVEVRAGEFVNPSTWSLRGDRFMTTPDFVEIMYAKGTP